MASGTGNSMGAVVMPAYAGMGASNSIFDKFSVLGSAPQTASLGGNTAAYESNQAGPIIKGGYIPKKTRKQPHTPKRKGGGKKSKKTKKTRKSRR